MSTPGEVGLEMGHVLSQKILADVGDSASSQSGDGREEKKEPDPSSISDMSKQVDDLLQKIREEKYKRELKENPPWKFTFNYKKLIDWGVPFLCIILVIAASASRDKRDDFGEPPSLSHTHTHTREQITTHPHKNKRHGMRGDYDENPNGSNRCKLLRYG